MALWKVTLGLDRRNPYSNALLMTEVIGLACVIALVAVIVVGATVETIVGTALFTAFWALVVFGVMFITVRMSQEITTLASGNHWVHWQYTDEWDRLASQQKGLFRRSGSGDVYIWGRGVLHSRGYFPFGALTTSAEMTDGVPSRLLFTLRRRMPDSTVSTTVKSLTIPVPSGHEAEAEARDVIARLTSG